VGSTRARAVAPKYPREVASGVSDDAIRLRRVRDTLGMSQRDLADEWKVSPAAIAKWELGTNPMPGPVRKLLEIYEQDLDLGLEQVERSTTLPRGFNGVVAFGSWVLFRYVFGAAGIFPSSSAREVLIRQFSNRLARHRSLMMKLGQMAAFIDPVLTEGERRALVRLRERAKPMTSAEVYRVVVGSLGVAPRDAFDRWTAAPHRCGSVGQVHRAEFAGRKVAVKVQYSDARRAMREDLDALQLLERWLKTAWPAQEPNVVFEELVELLEQELDFAGEANNLEHTRTLWADDSRVTIPAVIRERSGDDVVTMEWCNGQPLDEWIASASRSSRAVVAEVLWKFYVGSLYQDGRFNADAHPGNILVSPGERLAFVDFGRQKQVTPAFHAYFTECTRAVLERDWASVWKLSVDIGLANTTCAVHDLARQCLWFWLPNLLPEIRFTREHLARTIDDVTLRGSFRNTMSMSRDSVFVHHLHLSSYSLLASLDVTADYRSPILRILYPNGGAPAPYTADELASFGIVVGGSTQIESR